MTLPAGPPPARRRSWGLPGLRDAREKWELPLEEAAGRGCERELGDVLPWIPRRVGDVPRGAFDALAVRCALEGPHQLLVLPCAARVTGFADQIVISPESVLGLGARAVGLWTASPQPGVKVLIPLERISAIENISILLHGRLSFVSFGERLTIRYNTLARPALKLAIRRMRERLAGAPLPLPAAEASAAGLPVKWRRLLHGAEVRFREGSPCVFCYGVDPRESRDDIERGQLLAVNPYEVVYMCDPREASHNYGEDCLYIPRERISRVRLRERYLELISNGDRVVVPVTHSLRNLASRMISCPPVHS